MAEAPTSARSASRNRAGDQARAKGGDQPAEGSELGGQELGEFAAAICCFKFGPAAERFSADQDLRKRHQAGFFNQLCSAIWVHPKEDLFIFDPPSCQQRLRARAVWAWIRCVNGHLSHPLSVSAAFVTTVAEGSDGDPALKTLETEAIVLRSIRYGEADRILHLYTPDHGRVGAIAKGARKPTSKFGARLEPFMRVKMVLRAGRGDLYTVTGVETVQQFARLRETAAGLDWAARCCDAISRLLDGPDPHPLAYNLLANSLTAVNADQSLAGKGAQVSYRLKLLVAAGLQPCLDSCATCGSEGPLSAFSGSAGGVVCSACEADSFPIRASALDWLVSALAAPVAQSPPGGDVELRMAERCVNETVEHHANIRLRPASAR